METVYLNGQFIPKEEAKISPEDRGFLFAEGIYEVVRWYGRGFYDMPGHLKRLKRSLSEMKISWREADTFPAIAERLVTINGLDNRPAMVYLQVTRGAAKRSHNFPPEGTPPTSFANAFGFNPDTAAKENGIGVLLTGDTRWSRCDIKSTALLANTMGFQAAYEQGMKECIFERNGLITEGSRSNIFFILKGRVYTHPESGHILSGITRANVIRLAAESGITVVEEAVSLGTLSSCEEAFITNTSSEVTPVTEINGNPVGDGKPGRITMLLRKKFDSETIALKR